ncbi:protein of unknown function [Azospirillum baldaniorum]|uniref:Uncharacterized protein n=1 Tax=Azospirillum baldaniorum TaxID=1064539 RepID=A0A9P1JQT2_9PROT|nr:protein of unknown function [Azospirillum baldaniorum]
MPTNSLPTRSSTPSPTRRQAGLISRFARRQTSTFCASATTASGSPRTSRKGRVSGVRSCSSWRCSFEASWTYSPERKVGFRQCSVFLFRVQARLQSTLRFPALQEWKARTLTAALNRQQVFQAEAFATRHRFAEAP